MAPTARVDSVAGKRKRFRSGYAREFFGKTFSRGVKLLPDTTAAKTAEKSSSLRAGYFSLSHSSYRRGACAADKRERALYAGWSVWSPKSEHVETYTRARDLKLTRSRAPATTTNATQKRRGVILR